MYQNLDEYLVRLEVEGELLRIPWPVESRYEVAAITRKIAREQNLALWFEQVRGSQFPIVTNIFGSPKRMAWALGVDSLEILKERIAAMVDLSDYSSFGGLMGRASEIMGMLRSAGIMSFGSVMPQTSISQWEQLKPDLDQLPWFHHWPQESYPSLTVGQIITVHPKTKLRQIHTAQLFRLDAQTIGMEIPEINVPQPAAIVLGGDPAAMWAIHAPLPDQANPYWLAGWLRRRPVALITAQTQPIDVHADAEFVIEGELHPAERPNTYFADFDGFYHPPQNWAIFKVSAIAHRQGAVIPVAVPMSPSNEMTWLNQASEQIFAPLLHLIINEAEDVHLPAGGGFRNLAVVKIKSKRPGAAQKAMFGVWGLGKLAQNRLLIAVDDTVDIYDSRAVLQAVLSRVDWQKNITRAPGMVHLHDIHGKPAGYGTKIAIDATGPAVATPQDLEEKTDYLNNILGKDWRLWDNRLLIAQVPLEMATAHTIEQVWEENPNYSIILINTTINLDTPQDIAWYCLSTINWDTGLVFNSENSRVAGFIATMATSKEHGTLHHEQDVIAQYKDQLEKITHGKITR